MTEIPFTIEVIEKLRLNCHLAKHKHFQASTRGRHCHLLFGVPTVLISVLIGSAFFVELRIGLGDIAKWSAAGLGLTAALLSAVQTFFNFRKEYEIHRATGNKYLQLARECERLIALYFDKEIKLHDLSMRIEELNTQYAQITTTSESISTNDRDFLKAKELQDEKEGKDPSLVKRVREENELSANSISEMEKCAAIS
jgi:hypothetical protein